MTPPDAMMSNATPEDPPSNNGWPADDPQYRHGLRAIQYTPLPSPSLQILDQNRLPFSSELLPIATVKDACVAISNMAVRGAPAIAIVAVLAIAIELTSTFDINPSSDEARPQKRRELDESGGKLAGIVRKWCGELRNTRPTAVNLGNAMDEFEVLAALPDARTAAGEMVRRAEEYLELDLRDNRSIGSHGAEWISKLPHLSSTADRNGAADRRIRLLTHCNTGSLATAGHGTALGIIRTLYSTLPASSLEVFFTESRPRFQGARLTAMELIYERIPSRLICDSMAAALLSGVKGQISAVIVGADRIAADGSVANKIGTLGLAVLCKEFGVKFIVAATSSTVDLNTPSGESIEIEERRPGEMMGVRGPVLESVQRTEGETFENTIVEFDGGQAWVLNCNPRVSVWNPGFDVTPARLVDVIVTETGAHEKEAGKDMFNMASIVAKTPPR